MEIIKQSLKVTPEESTIDFDIAELYKLEEYKQTDRLYANQNNNIISHRMRLEAHDEVEFAQALPQKAFNLGVNPDICVNKNGSEFYKKLRTSFQQRSTH